MKKILILTCVSFFAALSINAQPLVPDTSFGSNGIVTTVVSPEGYYGATPTLLQPDGKILTASNFAMKAVVVRYLPNGELDYDWGQNGISKINPGFNQLIVTHDMSLLPDGKVLVLGYMDSLIQGNPYSAFSYLFRLSENGSLDTTFGTGGFVFINGSDYNNALFTNIVTIDSSIVLVGSGGGGVNSLNYRLLALNKTNGNINTAWGNNGILIFDVSSSITASPIKAKKQADNKILITNKGYFIRILPNGELDSTLHSNLGYGVIPTLFINGLMSSNLHNEFGTARGISIAFQNDNKILLAGIASMNSPHAGFGIVERYHEDGTIDLTFADKGVLLVDFRQDAPFFNVISDISFTNEGNIVVAGNVTDTLSGASYFAMAHFDNHGEAIEDIGNNSDGVMILNNFHASDSVDFLHEINIQPDNKILLSGCTPLFSTSVTPNEYLNSFSLARFEYQDTITSTINNLTTTPINNTEIVLYPNPTKGLVTIKYHLKESGSVRMLLYDSSGKLVHTIMENYQIEGTKQITFNLSPDFSAGNYLVVITTPNNEIFSGKLIKR